MIDRHVDVQIHIAGELLDRALCQRAPHSRVQVDLLSRSSLLCEHVDQNLALVGIIRRFNLDFVVHDLEWIAIRVVFEELAHFVSDLFW